jgi:regulator of sigma E protease
MSIIVFLIVLAILVLVHEFGHFFAAKHLGIRVDEFGLGFAPRMWGKKIGETIYSINWIPFGGFVRIFGETPDAENMSGPDASRSFINKPRWAQAIVLVAGVVMNILFAWVLFTIALSSGLTTGVSSQNDSYIENRRVIVTSVAPDSPASRMGIMAGDSVTAIRSRGATTTVSSVEVVQEAIKESLGGVVAFDLIRGDVEPKNVYLRVAPERGLLEDRYAVGISMDVVGEAKLPIHLAVVEAGRLTAGIFTGIFYHLYALIIDGFQGDADLSGLSGPVGIAGLVGDASRLGFVYLMSFTAFISLNLAALNLIPFPALDGGRLLFVLIEAIMRKPIRPNIANTINAIGFGILLLLMLFVTYRDIVKLF